MSQASGKKDFVKAKIERTSLGVKCMGLKSGSSKSKKDFGKKKTRTPARKVYKSKVRNKALSIVPPCEDVSDEEVICAENSPTGSNQDDVPDVGTSIPEDIHDQEIPEKESSAHEDSGLPTQSHGSSLLSKEDDPVHVSTTYTQSKESSQAPISVQNISDDDSDDVPLAGFLPDSVASRIKRQRRASGVEESSAPQKKSKSTLSTFKSKPVYVKGKENVQKWKFVCQRRIAKEREVGSDVLEWKEVVALIEKVGLMKTIPKVGRCYERLVKEFLVKLSEEVGLPKSVEFRKVYVRAKCVEFSHAVINKTLGRSDGEVVDEELSLDVIAKELTAGQVKKWPIKKLLSTGNLSTLKHADTCAVKLPFSFPSLLTEIILQQHP
ncbi:uncharacterized protein LOC130727315 [Lotus japonicus]|uniref:uncharacterized protein LOC130727315 n=1 Tax=Lotus japonicus TaxID=34305 RepID=UPI00259079BD|nr:uncharacterized protein LOC130727315 [Lotus japonicus]